MQEFGQPPAWALTSVSSIVLGIKAYKLPGVAQPAAAGTAAGQTVALLCPNAHAPRLSAL